MTKALTDDQTKSFVHAMFENANDPSARHTWYILFDVVGGDNSAIAAVKSSDTAYVHRDKLFLYQISDTSDGPYPEEGFALVTGLRESVTSLLDDDEWGMYPNYIDSQLDSKAAQTLYWGDNLERLQGIKSDIDPKDIFWNPQGVRPE